MNEARYYSGNGVDRLLIEELLPALGLSDRGYAVEAGAFDGENGSHTLALERAGWTVLCLEPQPRLEALGRSRRRLWRRAAIGARDQDAAEFWIYLTAGGGTMSVSALSGPDGVPYQHTVPGQPPLERIEVQVRTLDRALEEAGFPRLDVAAIDVEGREREALAGLALERWRVQILVVESFSYVLEPPPGYQTVGRYEYDNVFVRSEPWPEADVG